VRGRASETGIWFDGDTGEFRRLFLPTGAHSGNTVSSWLWALHFADVKDMTLYRVFVCLLGLAVAGLSGTGVYIWLKKRRAAYNSQPVLQLRETAMSRAPRWI
jgi:uncharacterized iron-regulated membrane protein